MKSEDVSRQYPQAQHDGHSISRQMKFVIHLSAMLAVVVAMTGCEVDSFFDPSRTGRFMPEPTMIPILDRIDVIETDETLWGETTGVMSEDLLPNDLTYVLAPGDYITVEVFEGIAIEQWRVYSRRIDPGGYFRIAELGDVRAAGRTVQEFEDQVADLMTRFVLTPRVFVHVEEGAAFTYTIHGHVSAPGLYTLRKSDLRLNEALAAVGGVPITAERVYVIRQVRLTEELFPIYDRDRLAPTPNARPQQPTQPGERPRTPVDIDELIDDLEDRPRAQPGMFGMIRDEPRPLKQDQRIADSRSSALASGLIDIDDLQPVRISERRIDVDELREIVPPRAMVQPPADETFIYIEERDEWVPARAARDEPAAMQSNARHPDAPPIDIDDPRMPMPTRPGAPGADDQELDEGPRLVTERIIEIPYERLLTDSRYDVVVRPNDRIYVEGPRLGLVYISGEIARPGVYELPQTGRLTLSRLVAAAGDLGPVAVPERVDLTRMVGMDREATLRLNLAAIRRRTEPDIVIKPDDHIIIGTSWVATPLAVIRNGFRATYGFGFLLDRNFGNDVFGAPPGARGF